MNSDELKKFLVKARALTYAGSGGKVGSSLKDSVQLEYKENVFLYRDLYYVGQGRFMGMESVYERDRILWSMTYFGNFSALTEGETDKILRKALTRLKSTTRLWNNSSWKEKEYEYVCEGYGDMNEFGGEETVTKNGNRVYYFYYTAGYVGKAKL